MNTELNTELNAELSTELSTPTPRTDAEATLVRSTENGVLVHAAFARTLERELHESRNAERLARVQFAHERERSLLLLAAMNDRDNGYIESRKRMSALESELTAKGQAVRNLAEVISGQDKELAREREKVRVLKLDKDRLDWWSGEPYYQFGKSHKCMNPGWWWSCGFESGMHSKYGIKNIRDAIDSAMAYSKSGRNKYNVCKRIEQSSTEDDK